MNAQIAQSQPLPVPTVAPPLVEGGMLVAITIYLIKEGLSFFRHKDASEERLTQMLIDDLRRERNEQLERISDVLENLEASQKEIANANAKIAAAIADINLANQQNARIHSEIFAQLRSQEKLLLSLQGIQK